MADRNFRESGGAGHSGHVVVPAGGQERTSKARERGRTSGERDLRAGVGMTGKSHQRPACP